MTYIFQSAASSLLSGLLLAGLNGMNVLRAVPLGVNRRSYRMSLPVRSASYASRSEMTRPSSWLRGGHDAFETTWWSCSSRAVTRRVVIFETRSERSSEEGRMRMPSDLRMSLCLFCQRCHI